MNVNKLNKQIMNKNYQIVNFSSAKSHLNL